MIHRHNKVRAGLDPRTNRIVGLCAIVVAIGQSIVGCSSVESEAVDAPPPIVEAAPPSRAPPPAAMNTPVTVPIDRLGAGVVVDDPLRVARAYENGPVGAAPPAVPEVLVDPRPTPEPTDPPEPPNPTVSARVHSHDTIIVSYRCSAGTLVRTDPAGVRTNLATHCGQDETHVDSGLEQGKRYCYSLGSAGPSCVTTRWRPYVFENAAISQDESDQMAAQFDWTHTDAAVATVTTGRGIEQALYSMAILLQNKDDFLSIRGLGIHTQRQPLLANEQAAWDGTTRVAMSAAGAPLGTWVTAVVPGPVYNDLRAQAIAGVANGHPIGIRAMVFRRIGIPMAAHYPNTTSISPLSSNYLGQLGLEFNGYSAVSCDNGSPRLCTVQQQLLGWLVNKVITLAVSLVTTVVDAVRQVFGAIERLLLGDRTLTINFVLKSSDAGFGTDQLTRSGWKQGQPLLLNNLPVRVYQNVALFIGRTDPRGVATIDVAQHVPGKICIELDNDHLKFVDFFMERVVCVGEFAGGASALTVNLETTDKWLNAFEAMTDAADYTHTVMGVDTPKINVVTGYHSDLLTAISPDGRAFTPCLGHMPNIVAELASGVAGLAVSHLVSEIALGIASYDIVLDGESAKSRGVGVHEYGHAVMCDLMQRADYWKASRAWASVLTSTLGGQDPSSEPAVLAESFADYFSLQVVGGTHYGIGFGTRVTNNMRYCLASMEADDCFEFNNVRCDGAGCTFEENVNWGVSVLQDVFDRVPVDDFERDHPSFTVPNDGSHWGLDAAEVLVPNIARRQVSGATSEHDTVQLSGQRMRDIFTNWASQGSALDYRTFFGGVAKTLRGNGVDRPTACAMYQQHEPGGLCPEWFIAAHGGAEPPPEPEPQPDAGPPPPPPPPPCVSTGNPCGDRCAGTATDNCGTVFACQSDCGMGGLCPCRGGSCGGGGYCICRSGTCF